MSSANDFVIENGVLKEYIGEGGDVVVPDGVTTVATGAFSKCSKITRVSFPRSVRDIPDQTFYSSTKVFSELVLYDDYPGDNEGRMTDLYFPQHSSNLTDRAYYIVTVKNAETDAVKYRVFLCGAKETQEINEALISAWGPYCAFNFKAADVYFGSYKDLTDRLVTAKLRLDYPVDLDAEEEKKYRDFIKRNGYKWFPRLIEAGNEQVIRWLIENEAVTKTRVNSLIELASKSGQTAITAMLMDHKAKSFGNMEPKLSLSEKTPKLWEVKKETPELLWRYNGTDTELTLPVEWNGKVIFGVADTVFKKPENYQQIEKLEIPEGYRSIGKDAFSGCRSLKEIVFPSTLETLGENCFSDCVSLRRVDLPDSLKTWGAGSFANCSALEEVRLPASVQRIPAQAFFQCQKLKTIVFPESLYAIGSEAFRYCPALKEIDLGENVSILGDRCFYMTKLETVIIRGKKLNAGDSPCFEYPRYVYTDGEVHAIGLPQASRMPLSYLGLKNKQLVKSAGNSYLKGLTIYSLGQLKAFPKINDYRYSNMEFSQFVAKLGGTYSNKLTKTTDLLVTYHIDVENATIQRAIKQGTAVMTELDFLQMVQRHGPIDLSLWRSGAEAAVQAGLKAVSKDDPYRPALMKKLWGYTELDDGTVRLNGYKGEATEVEIPPRIGSKPVSVIGKGALSPVKGSIGGMSRATNAEARKNITRVVFPNCVSVIEEGVFYKCQYLRDVLLPAGLTKIGAYAFYECGALEKLRLPASVTEINYWAFRDCASLTEIKLPEGLRELSSELFSGCSSLENICIPDSVELIESSAFEDCTSLKEINLPKNLKKIAGYAFKGCRSLNSLTLSDDVIVCSGAFMGCAGMANENGWLILRNVLDGYFGEKTELRIPDGVELISRNAFAGNLKLESVIVPESVRKIATSAFDGCTALQCVQLSEGLKSLDIWAFRSCTSLKEITLPESLESLDGDVFRDCISLETVTILGKDTQFIKSMFGEFAFDGCSNLEHIRTPNPKALPTKNQVLAEKL